MRLLARWFYPFQDSLRIHLWMFSTHAAFYQTTAIKANGANPFSSGSMPPRITLTDIHRVGVSLSFDMLRSSPAYQANMGLMVPGDGSLGKPHCCELILYRRPSFISTAKAGSVNAEHQSLLPFFSSGSYPHKGIGLGETGLIRPLRSHAR